MTVTINREKLKNYVKEKLLEVILQRSKAWQHTSHDYRHSPSEWAVDKEGTIRHRLKTGIATSISDNTLIIDLTYEVIDIS